MNTGVAFESGRLAQVVGKPEASQLAGGGAMFESVWAEGKIIREVSVERPVLASWDRKVHPSQIRLDGYLSNLIPALLPLPAGNAQLSLHYEIGVDNPSKLLVGCDLENYLFPLFGRRHLNAGRFAYVSGRKSIGGSSSVRIGYAVPQSAPNDGWARSYVSASSGSSTKAWKQRVRDALAIDNEPLKPGSVKAQIAFRCSSQRNWTLLWKPSGDAMGPILGTTREKGFHPCDDRIVDLTFHKLIDDSLGHDVHLGYWWCSTT